MDTLAAALACLDEGGIHVVLSDLDLPDSQAGETIERLRTHAPHMPIVVLAGREDEALARDAVRAGVEDYLLKREMSGTLLAHALQYAIERQRAKAALQEAHDELERRVRERTTELEQTNRERPFTFPCRYGVVDGVCQSVIECPRIDPLMALAGRPALDNSPKGRPTC